MKDASLREISFAAIARLGNSHQVMTLDADLDSASAQFLESTNTSGNFEKPKLSPTARPMAYSIMLIGKLLSSKALISCYLFRNALPATAYRWLQRSCSTASELTRSGPLPELALVDVLAS